MPIVAVAAKRIGALNGMFGNRGQCGFSPTLDQIAEVTDRRFTDRCGIESIRPDATQDYGSMLADEEAHSGVGRHGVSCGRRNNIFLVSRDPTIGR
jgi:hypothetical protein